jgi:hypothetical protein
MALQINYTMLQVTLRLNYFLINFRWHYNFDVFIFVDGYVVAKKKKKKGFGCKNPPITIPRKLKGGFPISHV